MVIRELYVKNFGKLSEKHFYFRDGVQVISGENEFGKTTLHAFVKAMLFGLERGRGRAAAKDDLQSMSRAAAAGMPVSCGLTAEGDIFVLNVHSEQGLKILSRRL